MATVGLGAHFFEFLAQPCGLPLLFLALVYCFEEFIAPHNREPARRFRALYGYAERLLGDLDRLQPLKDRDDSVRR